MHINRIPDHQAASSLHKEYTALKRKNARLQREYDNLMQLYKQAVAMRDYNEKEKKIQMQYNQMLRDNSPDDIFLLDTEMNVLLCTSQVKRNVGRDVVGEPFLPLLKESFGEPFSGKMAAALQEVFRSAESLAIDGRTNEHFGKMSGGKDLFFSFRISPTLDSGGKLNGVVVLAHDNTEMHHANVRAEAAARAKSNFLANMSHEIRTPLNAIIGMTQIGLAADEYQKTQYCLGKIAQASKQLLSLTNDILDISKIDADYLELAESVFDIRAMLDSLLSVHSVRAEEKSIALSMTFSDDFPQYVSGDELRLSQIIMNLLANAVKFTPEKGRVTLHAAMREELAQGSLRLDVSVIDSGIGVNMEQRERLFELFEQADSGTAKKYGGTGLGLALSRKLTRLMNGDINVHNMPEGGACFYFHVLLGQVEPSAAELYAQHNEHSNIIPDLSAYTVLIAEDIEINREIALALLEDTHIHIECAENGLEAVEIFACAPYKFDIILMDIQMPVMDGLEATRQIRALDIPEAARIPIVAMTANAFANDVSACKKAGMTDHIGKPFNAEIFINKLAMYLRKRTLV